MNIRQTFTREISTLKISRYFKHVKDLKGKKKTQHNIGSRDRGKKVVEL